MNNKLGIPKIFISYSWTNPLHEKWVIDLAERLSTDGIYVVLDKWDLKEGQDKHTFMEKMVNDESITKVLVICDKEYQIKANQRKGGVGTESQLISQEVYENTEQEKFIPIVKECDDSKKPCIPKFMASRIFIDLSSNDIFENNYQKLVRNLYGKPEIKRPMLGITPTYIFNETEINPSKARQQLQTIENSLLKGKKSIIKGQTYDFLENLLTELEQNRLTGGNQPDFDEEVMKSIEKMLKLRDAFIDFCLGIFKYSKKVDLETFKDFFERILLFLQRPTNAEHWHDNDFDNFIFILYEMFLYFLTILLKLGRYDEAAYFINANYFDKNLNTGEINTGGIYLFDRYPRSLEEIRNRRLNLKRISIVADLIKQRATKKEIQLDELLQTDTILYSIDKINKLDRDIWFPRTSVYRPRFSGIEIFQKMISGSFFEQVKVLFDVNNKNELKQKIEKYIEYKNTQEESHVASWEYNIPLIEKIIDINKIAIIR